MKLGIQSIFVATSLSLVSFASLANDSGVIQFEGAITDTPCVVDHDDANQTVGLGQYKKDAFNKKGDTSAPVSFEIKLLGCATDTFANASVKFAGHTIPDSPTTLALSANQAGDTIASGVGIQILQNNTPVAVDGNTTAGSITLEDGDNTFRFLAQYVAVADEVTAGSAHSYANFSISYK